MDKLSGDKVFVGYDLCRRYAQISYCFAGGGQPETISTVAGGENYNIPLALCKRRGVNQWFYGKEACRYAQEGDGTLVENLLELARDKERVSIEGEEFEPVALLALFIKRSLSLLSGICPQERIGGIMFTCDGMDRETLEIIDRAVSGLGLKTQNIFCQGHVESIYYYNISQQPQLWNHQVLVCDYQEDRIRIYLMERNLKTSPVVVLIGEDMYPFRAVLSIPVQEDQRQEVFQGMDREFLELMQRVCEGRLISSVYLLGDGFRGEWLNDSLVFLCRNRRVFQGNNLFSKGACYSLTEKNNPSEAGKSHVFLGSDKLKANIGMRVLRRGADSYFALLDAGTSWFEARRELDFLLESGCGFTVLITPLNGREVRTVEIRLEGIPERPEGTTRLRLAADMPDVCSVRLCIEDMGFGEIFPASGMQWTETLEV
ncbi:MAG: hypothetical protein HDR26_09115 [Lachnospiraceae bacterium]|nr:hypothetical protein [Lachnospiraceae bacterium]